MDWQPCTNRCLEITRQADRDKLIGTPTILPVHARAGRGRAEAGHTRKPERGPLFSILGFGALLFGLALIFPDEKNFLQMIACTTFRACHSGRRQRLTKSERSRTCLGAAPSCPSMHGQNCWSCGEFVRRFVELPNGARIPLPVPVAYQRHRHLRSATAAAFSETSSSVSNSCQGGTVSSRSQQRNTSKKAVNWTILPLKLCGLLLFSTTLHPIDLVTTTHPYAD
jgi:hypothetical protein